MLDVNETVFSHPESDGGVSVRNAWNQLFNNDPNVVFLPEHRTRGLSDKLYQAGLSQFFWSGASQFDGNDARFRLTIASWKAAAEFFSGWAVDRRLVLSAVEDLRKIIDFQMKNPDHNTLHCPDKDSVKNLFTWMEIVLPEVKDK